MPFLPTNLQKIYPIGCSLSNYARSVKEKEWEFPSFRDCCPICFGKNCAKRNGFYTRVAIEKDGKEKDIPVARWECGRKGEVDDSADRTFSLLPHPLVPYRRYSAAVQYETFKQAAINGTKGALDALQPVLEGFCERTISFVILLFQAAFLLLLQAKFVPETHCWKEALIELVENYEGGLLGLIIAFYVAQHEFLLGNPSQHRKPRKKLKKA